MVNIKIKIVTLQLVVHVCPAGSITNKLANTGATTCTACDAGEYSADSEVACAVCPAGSITNKLANTGATTCTACDAGEYSADSEVACAVCPAGSITNTLANTGATTCTACDAGEYSADSEVACAVCPAGSITNTLANTGATTCTECDAGEYSADSKVACVACPTGFYQNSIEQTACIDVAAGKEGQSSVNVYVATGAVKETACAAGKFNTNGDGACATCVAGSETDTATTGGSTCKACDAGFYSTQAMVESQTTCDNCNGQVNSAKTKCYPDCHGTRDGGTKNKAECYCDASNTQSGSEAYFTDPLHKGVNCNNKYCAVEECVDRCTTNQDVSGECTCIEQGTTSLEGGHMGIM